jgi:2'-5' RNA ligase
VNLRTAQYFIGIGLPKKEDKLFSFLKEQFHPKNNLSSPAHITLIPPFFYENESGLVLELESWAKKQTKFESNFEKIGSFNQSKYGTVFLAPDESKNFKKIYFGLIEVLPSLTKKYRNNFVPHLTIANRAPLDQMKNIETQLRNMQIKLKLKVKGVSLYKRTAGRSWSKYMEFNFS